MGEISQPPEPHESSVKTDTTTMVPQNNPPELVATFDCTPDGSRTSQCGVVSPVNAQNHRSSHDVLFADDKSPQHSLRLLGSDLLSTDFVKRCF